MEVDHEFLWMPERKKYLKEFVSNLFQKLNDPSVLEQGSFCIPLDFNNSFSFKFQASKEKPQDVRDFDVAIFKDVQSATGLK